MTFSEKMTALRINCSQKPGPLRKKAESLLQQVEDLKHNHPDNQEFVEEKQGGLLSEAGRLNAEADKWENRHKALIGGKFPMTRSEYSDSDWMENHHELYSEAMTAGVVVSAFADE